MINSCTKILDVYKTFIENIVKYKNDTVETAKVRTPSPGLSQSEPKVTNLEPKGNRREPKMRPMATKIHPKICKNAPKALDRNSRKKLWDISEELMKNF